MDVNFEDKYTQIHEERIRENPLPATLAQAISGRCTMAAVK